MNEKVIVSISVVVAAFLFVMAAGCSTPSECKRYFAKVCGECGDNSNRCKQVKGFSWTADECKEAIINLQEMEEAGEGVWSLYCGD